MAKVLELTVGVWIELAIVPELSRLVLCTSLLESARTGVHEPTPVSCYIQLLVVLNDNGSVY